MKRIPETIPEFNDELLNQLTDIDLICVIGVEMLTKELENDNPDLDERCGLLNSQHEVYALRIPEWSEHVYVVSLDISQSEPWPCKLHGLLSQRGRPCEAARHLVVQHFNLINPSWEPADDN